MAESVFPASPIQNQHFVDGNRLWVWDGSTWNLWGNLQYVPVPGAPGRDGSPGIQGPEGPAGGRGLQGKDGDPGRVGPQGPEGKAGQGLNIKIVVKDSATLYDQVGNDGVTGPNGGTLAPNDDLYKYREYTPEVGDCATTAYKDENYQMWDEIVGEYGYDANSIFLWSMAKEWEYVGSLGVTVGPEGKEGIQGPEGDPGLPGVPGRDGLNGAHGGANAQLINYVPSAGPPGRMYLFRDNMTLYVTTAQAEY